MTAFKPLVCVLALVLCLSLSSCIRLPHLSDITDAPHETPSTSETVTDPAPVTEEHQTIYAGNHYAGEVLDYFSEVAFGSEYGESDSLLCRWESPIVCRVSGAREDDTVIIDYLFSMLNEIEGFPGIRKAGAFETPNFTVDFVSSAELTASFENADEGTVGMSEFTWLNATHEIISARAAIYEDEEYERASTICEEILQSLGIGNDSYMYPDSVFYQGPCYYQRPSDMDRAVLAVLYSPALRTGMTKTEALSAAVPLLDWDNNR